MATTQYYVYSVDTSTGVSYTIETTPNWTGPGTLVGGPYATKAAAQAFISSGGATKGLASSVLAQDAADVGDWVVVPEGEAGKITQALAYTGTDFVTALVGSVKGDLAVGGDVTVQQLTTAQQVENAETAGLVLYPTKAAAQAAANAQNGASNPAQANPLSGLAAIGAFFGTLGQASTWEMVGEVLLGLILLGVGVARLTHAQNFISTAVKAAAV